MDRISASWQDAVNFLLGIALLISPFVLGFRADQTPAWNAYIVGAIIAIMALAAMFAFQPWEEWISAILGAWLIISPWVLGFNAGHSTAMTTHVVIGIATLVLALWAVREHDSGHLPAGR